MKSISKYFFHKTKYGELLLIDVVELKDIKKYLRKDPVHFLTYYDITFISSGEGDFCLDGDSYEVKSNDVIFSKPGEIRSWSIDTIQNGYALIFEEEFLLSFFNDPDFINNLAYFTFDSLVRKITLSEKLSRKIISLIKEIKGEIAGYQEKDTHILRALLYEILILLHREYIKRCDRFSDRIQNRHVNRFFKLLNMDCAVGQPVSYYADKLCMTSNYLNEIVKSSTGVNVKSHIQNRVLLEAKRLLTYSSLSIAEIAERLNFNSSSYFIRFFHQKTGMTPHQYRTINL